MNEHPNDVIFLLEKLGSVLSASDALRCALEAFNMKRGIEQNVQQMSITDLVKHVKNIERIRFD